MPQAKKTESRDQKEEKLSDEQIKELERHDVPPSEQHLAQTLRERPAAIPDQPLFRIESVQGVPLQQRLGGADYPLPHRNEYPDAEQAKRIEAVQKRLQLLRIR